MKSVIALACLLAVASAQFSNGQYFPKNDGSYYNNQNRYNPYNNRYNQYNRFPQYQNNPYYNSFSSTPFPKPVFVSSTPSPVSSVAPVVSSVASVTTAPVVPVPVAPVAPVVAARVVSDARSAETVKYGNEINPDGTYSYFYETNNGISAQEQGAPRNFGDVSPDVAQGAFSWTSPEGEVISISYVADENGYQPTGNAIPQPPPIPEQIARALEYIARNAPLAKSVEKK